MAYLTVQIGVSIAKTIMKMNGISSLGVASYMKCGVQLAWSFKAC